MERGLFFPGMFGHLTDKNNPYISEQNEGLFLFPQGSYLMDPSTLYGRVSVSRISLSSVFDYVWRLTYKDHPASDKGYTFYDEAILLGQVLFPVAELKT